MTLFVFVLIAIELTYHKKVLREVFKQMTTKTKNNNQLFYKDIIFQKSE